MKRRIYSLKNWLIAASAGLLGINVGCHSFAAMYGCPYAKYEVTGRVTNEQGAPVKGISMSIHGDTVLTNSEGRYELEHIDSPWSWIDDSGLELKATDIDGAENGSYQDTSVNLSFEGARFVDADGEWYEGCATVNQDIVLKEN